MTLARPTEAHERELAAAVVAVLAGWRPGRAAVVAALAAGSAPEKAVGLNHTDATPLSAAIYDVLGAVWLKSFLSAAGRNGRPVPIGGAHDWASERAEQITVTSMGTISQIARYLRPDDDIWQNAGVLNRSVGLTPQQALAVENFRRGMLEVAESTVTLADNRADAMADSRLGDRADVIGKTETWAAYRQPKLDAYDERGVNFVRFVAWDGCCPECDALDGTEYPVDEAPPDGGHPNCICDYEPVEDEVSQ